MLPLIEFLTIVSMSSMSRVSSALEMIPCAGRKVSLCHEKPGLRRRTGKSRKARSVTGPDTSTQTRLVEKDSWLRNLSGRASLLA